MWPPSCAPLGIAANNHTAREQSWFILRSLGPLNQTPERSRPGRPHGVAPTKGSAPMNGCIPTAIPRLAWGSSLHLAIAVGDRRRPTGSICGKPRFSAGHGVHRSFSRSIADPPMRKVVSEIGASGPSSRSRLPTPPAVTSRWAWAPSPILTVTPLSPLLDAPRLLLFDAALAVAGQSSCKATTGAVAWHRAGRHCWRPARAAIAQPCKAFIR